MDEQEREPEPDQEIFETDDDRDGLPWPGEIPWSEDDE